MPDLLIYGDIGDDPWSWEPSPNTMTSVANWLAENAKGAKEITVRINSYGGVVSDGVGIYNLLVQHGAKITCIVEGFALSAASVIAMAGDQIRMLPGTLMMIHPASGACRGTAKDMEITAKALNAMTDNAVNIYADRTGQSKEKCAELVDAETYMTPAEAKTLGFCDEVVPGKKPAAAPTTTQRAKQYLSAYKNMPANMRKALMSAASDELPPPSSHGKHAQRFSNHFTTAKSPLAELARSGLPVRLGD